MIRNGIDTDHLASIDQALRQDPAAAEVTIVTRQRWEGAYDVTSKTVELRVGDEVLPRSHELRCDLPAPLGGSDHGPVPGELLLTALAACVAGQLAEQAALRDVEMVSAEVRCTGKVDLRGGIDGEDVRPGLQEVQVAFEVDADADAPLLAELFEAAVRSSPVADSLAHPVPLVPTIHSAATQRA